MSHQSICINRVCLSLFLLFAIGRSGYGQEKVYQLSGLVLDRQTGEPVPYTKIETVRNKRIVFANKEGFFSIPVTEQDTVVFSSVGYKQSILSIQAYLKAYKPNPDEIYIYEIHYLLQDTITLPTIYIFPYRTPEELKTAILNMPMEQEVSMARAQQNVSPELMKYFFENLPADPEERKAIALQRYQELYHRRNVMPFYPLMDPLAVYRLIDYLAKKSKKENQVNLGTWEDE